MSSELRKIIESADGVPKTITRYKDLEKVRVNGSINVLVEENLFKEIDYISNKFNIQIISKDQFYNYCLKQHLPHQILLA
jgi:hypothetical protein